MKKWLMLTYVLVIIFTEIRSFSFTGPPLDELAAFIFFHMFMLFHFYVTRIWILVLNPFTSSESPSIIYRYKSAQYTHTTNAFFHVNIDTVLIISETGRKLCCLLCHWCRLLTWFWWIRHFRYCVYVFVFKSGHRAQIACSL